jgi:hypothetical protein
MMNIENDDDENSEIAGLRFRYDCSSGVFADITLSTEELNTEHQVRLRRWRVFGKIL